MTNSHNIMSAATTNTAKSKSGLDILSAAIDYQQARNETPSSSSTSSKQPLSQNSKPVEKVSVNPFRSKMDPRMRKSIAARAMNPTLLDEEAVMTGFVFPKRGTKADINWIGEGNVSMRQRKINFRRSWKRFYSKKIKDISIVAALSTPVVPSSPVNAVSSSDEEHHHKDTPFIASATTALVDYLSDVCNPSISRNLVPPALPKKKSARSFPATLLSIISNPEYDHIISWLPSGEAFGIHNRKDFESEILPKYFSHARFNSFVRKLNRWGFRRVNKDCGAPYLCGSILFCHDNFKRDAPDNMVKKRMLDNNTKVSIDEFVNKTKSNEVAVCQATLALAPAMPALRSVSFGANDLVVPNGINATLLPDPMAVELNRLLIQRQKHLDYMSQKTKHSRALLYSMRL
mmetsp:Transcript_15654/g.24296  ORF Transcript_15654/g.24296 Transcript_15654/m.24296 type:complete len:403 (-) Transcript_15654:96-1304(-)